MIRTAIGSNRIVFQRGSRITRDWIGEDMPESSLAPWAEQWTNGGWRPYFGPKEKRKSNEPVRNMACSPALKSAHSMILSPSLRAFVRQQAEDRPGIYKMLGPQNEVLYVGKSVRVKSRLLSYFRAEPGEKAAKLIRNTIAIEWDYLPNEFAALVREMRLIKRWRPRYNVEHKRKRSYAFVKITREPAPRIIPVARILPDGATYFGPFPRPKFLALTLGELSHVMGLRDCHGTIPIVFGDQLEFFDRGRAPRCIRAQTGSCLGPCFGGCISTDYARNVETARRFLEGRSRKPLSLLRKEMGKASEGMEFEYAAIVRDRLERLGTLQRELVAFRGRVDGLSFVYRVPGFNGDDRLYLIRKGLVEEEILNPRGKAGRQRVAKRVETLFQTPPPQVGVLTQEAAAEILLVARWFRLRQGELARVSKPEDWLSACAPSS
ncbi:MAG: UvrB/UvrC motif-containing protein [Longimicrobiales bacterium]|nr:UvrB/UvrC motif-containing protein [Longimicrobiales bacterium]